jgi:hypothetical protein
MEAVVFYLFLFLLFFFAFLVGAATSVGVLLFVKV